MDMIAQANIVETKDGDHTDIVYYVVSTFFEPFNEDVVYPYVAGKRLLPSTILEDTT